MELGCNTDETQESLEWEKEYFADGEAAFFSASSSLPLRVLLANGSSRSRGY